MSKALYKTSINDSVATPPALYDDLDAYFAFDFDPCPLDTDTTMFDGLQAEWGISNFVNPPYSDVAVWIRKALEQRQQTVMLIPAKMSTKYWRELVWPNADRIYFFMKGVKFVGYKREFPAPMSVVVFFSASASLLPNITSLGGLPVVSITSWSMR